MYAMAVHFCTLRFPRNVTKITRLVCKYAATLLYSDVAGRHINQSDNDRVRYGSCLTNPPHSRPCPQFRIPSRFQSLSASCRIPSQFRQYAVCGSTVSASMPAPPYPPSRCQCCQLRRRKNPRRSTHNKMILLSHPKPYKYNSACSLYMTSTVVTAAADSSLYFLWPSVIPRVPRITCLHVDFRLCTMIMYVCTLPLNPTYARYRLQQQ